jgi:hypothetical protein
MRGNLTDAPAHQHHYAFKELGPLARSSFQYHNPQVLLVVVRRSVLQLLVFHNRMLTSIQSVTAN